MDTPVKLSHTSALILQTISHGYCYGFDIMDVTGLPSGTVYPALRRLERDRLIHSKWESEAGPGAPAEEVLSRHSFGRRGPGRCGQTVPASGAASAGGQNEGTLRSRS